MEFGILFTVYLRHSYSSNGRLGCITVAPDHESQQLIRNKGLLFKPFRDSFSILYETSMAGRPRSRGDLMREAGKLRFVMSLQDPCFYNYTSGDFADIKGSVFHFRNFNDEGQPPLAKGFLHEDAAVSEKDFVSLESLEETSFVKPFGLVDMLIAPGLEQSYTIQFSKRSTYWRYVLSGEHLMGLNSPAVVGNGVSFSGPETMTLPDSRQAIAFVSADPIGLAESTKDTFQLVENYEAASGKYKVVMRTLPVPDAKAVSAMPGSDKNNRPYSEIFVFI